jgi:hypothetical protein
LVHFSAKGKDSKPATATAPVISLEPFLILVVCQGEREPTGGSDLTMHKSLRLRKDKHMCHDPRRKNDGSHRKAFLYEVAKERVAKLFRTKISRPPFPQRLGKASLPL